MVSHEQLIMTGFRTMNQHQTKVHHETIILIIHENIIATLLSPQVKFEKNMNKSIPVTRDSIPIGVHDNVPHYSYLQQDLILQAIAPPSYEATIDALVDQGPGCEY